MPCQIPCSGWESGNGSPAVRKRPLQHPLQECRSHSSKRKQQPCNSLCHPPWASDWRCARQGCETSLQSQERGKHHCWTPKMSQPEGWRQKSIWMEKSLIPWATWRSTLVGDAALLRHTNPAAGQTQWLGAELCWPGTTQKHSWFVLYMPFPALPSLVLLIRPQHPWLRALFHWQIPLQ